MGSPVHEIRVIGPVGESLSANTDSFKYTITGQLVHDQVSVHESRCLDLVRHNTSDEMGMCRFQSGHQIVQLLLNGGVNFILEFEQKKHIFTFRGTRSVRASQVFFFRAAIIHQVKSGSNNAGIVYRHLTDANCLHV